MEMDPKKKILDVTCGSKNCMVFGNRETVSPRDLALLPPIFNAISRIFRFRIIPFLSLCGIPHTFVKWKAMRGWLRSMESLKIIGRKCFMTGSANVCEF